MAEITAGRVKELREMTGLGMMECKKALTEADGDLKKAEELLRIKSGAKAGKAASRIAAEGVIGAYLSPDAKAGALVELPGVPDDDSLTAGIARHVPRQPGEGEFEKRVGPFLLGPVGALSEMAQADEV